MNMSTVYSELSLDYASALGGGNQISLFRIRTNNDNSGNVSGLVLNPMDAVPLAQRHLFEIQVVPTGDTGRIISNTFGAGYTRMDSAKRLTHRIERAVADAPGTTSGSLTCTVNVRRIAYHADAYSRQMVLNHSITTEGTSGGGGTTPPPPSSNTDGAAIGPVIASYMGQDRDIGFATAALQLSYGSIRAVVHTRSNNPRDINNFFDDYILFTFDSNSPIQLDTYEANIEIISMLKSDIGTSYTHATGSSWLRMTTTNPVVLWSQRATYGGGHYLGATLRIRVRRRSDQVVVMNKTVYVETDSIN